MIRPRSAAKALVALSMSLALMPCVAMADDEPVNLKLYVPETAQLPSIQEPLESDTSSAALLEQADSYNDAKKKEAEAAAAQAEKERAEKKRAEEEKKKSATDKTLKYDRALIKKIGTQEKTGHTICCPSFSCAYADAILDGTVHDHSYYTCSSCTWPDWGGGNSSNRCVGSDQELLREAYDQIKSGKPTVIHVAASYGEHWIALFGYHDAADPDHLTLANFVALDPWDGTEINPADRFTLYGDGCEHISDR